MEVNFLLRRVVDAKPVVCDPRGHRSPGAGPATATPTGWGSHRSRLCTVSNTIPVRTLPGRTLDSTRCRRCDEQETLPHVLGFCHHGELLRINRHNTVRSLIAPSIRQNASYEVYEEFGCVSFGGSPRRADIIIIGRQKDKGVILDPTIRFEMHEQQPQEVCREKQVMYEPCCQHLGAQYHITHWTVLGSCFVPVARSHEKL
ncbi:hypothetical protein ANN_10369 [Periplaneta americana]|uniref:Uncharacterized protein n=1 Tax=Periplaneta americana TaxID=6978 RepID=A0ABQ8TRZ4_PERAM|nr:hypothetical protein ANN_10369 [Periplaneta americana]